jgi:hypothetical protein
MRYARITAGLSLISLVGGAGLARAATPATVITTYYAAQKGCGSSIGPARLESRIEQDDSPGCTPGGVPANEVLHQLGMGVPTRYTSTTHKPFTLDLSQPITGQVAAASPAGQGNGQIIWEVTVSATTSAGKVLDLGRTTLEVLSIFPYPSVVDDFTLPVPAAAKGQKFKSIILEIEIHGASAGMTGRKLDGLTYVKVPARPA